jgi:hypothetical protein
MWITLYKYFPIIDTPTKNFLSMTLPPNIQKSFELFAKTIIDMREEIAALEKKFGTSSDLVAKKRRQLQSLIDFYKAMQDCVPKMHAAMRLAAINQEALLIMENKRALGISWAKAKEMLGVPETMIKDLTTVDEVLARIVG